MPKLSKIEIADHDNLIRRYQVAVLLISYEGAEEHVFSEIAAIREEGKVGQRNKVDVLLREQYGLLLLYWKRNDVGVQDVLVVGSTRKHKCRLIGIELVIEIDVCRKVYCRLEAQHREEVLGLLLLGDKLLHDLILNAILKAEFLEREESIVRLDVYLKFPLKIRKEEKLERYAQC